MNALPFSENDHQSRLHRVWYTLSHYTLPTLILPSTQTGMFSPTLDESKAVSQLDLKAESLNALELVPGPGKQADKMFLQATWQMACHEAGVAKGLLPLGDYKIMHYAGQDTEAILFVFQVPCHLPGAFFTAAIRQQHRPYRYFTLELNTDSPNAQEKSAVLGEWSLDRTHHNYGRYRGCIQSREQFLVAAYSQYLKPTGF